MKTRKELFEERLKELGLLKDWSGYGRVGKTLCDGTIAIMVHESDSDNFSEIHYVPFDILRKDSKFVTDCLNIAVKEWEYEKKDFEELSSWLYGYTDICPLDAGQVYFPASHLTTFYKDFVDEGTTPYSMLMDEFNKRTSKKRLSEIDNLYDWAMDCFMDSIKPVENAFPNLKKLNTEDGERWWDNYRQDTIDNYVEDSKNKKLESDALYNFIIVENDGKAHSWTYGVDCGKPIIYGDFMEAENDFVLGDDLAIISVAYYCKLNKVEVSDIMSL